MYHPLVVFSKASSGGNAGSRPYLRKSVVNS